MEWAGVVGAAAAYFAILAIWARIDKTITLLDDIELWIDPNELKGRPKKIDTKIKRWIERSENVRFATSWAVERAWAVLRFGFIFQFIFFLVTALLLQPYLILPAGLTLSERAGQTVIILSLSLADALSFDLFEVAGIEAKPRFDAIQGRIIIWAYYVLSGVLLVKSLKDFFLTSWSALVASLFPETSMRLIKDLRAGREVTKQGRKLIKLITVF